MGTYDRGVNEFFDQLFPLFLIEDFCVNSQRFR